MNAPTSRTLSDQLRKLLVLTAPEAPIEKRPPFTVGAGMRAAIEAARAGDAKAADEIEFAWRDLLGPRPQLGEDDERRGLVPMANRILRNWGPRAETAIEWNIVLPCPRCYRRLTLRSSCHRCSGQGHISEEWETILMTLDGVVFEEVWP